MNALAGTNIATGGNTPNWVTGYVPPASEWNAWWGAKLDVVGGVLNGDMTVNGTLAATIVDAQTVNAADHIYTPSLILPNGWALTNDASNNDLYQHTSGNYDLWQRSTGSRYWFANGTAVMTVDAVGNLTVPGNVNAKAVGFSSGFVITQNASNDDLIEHSAGNYEVWVRSNGARAWVTNSVNVMTLDGSGNLSITGNFVPSGAVTVSGTLTGLGAITSVGAMSCGGGLSIASQQVSDFDMYRVAPNRVLQWGSGHNISWNELDGGSVSWNNPTIQMMKVDAAGNFTAHGTVHGSNVTAMQEMVDELQEMVDELQALVRDLQTRLETLEAQPKT